MMNKLDELFKEKLSDYAVAPSAGAWDKVEAGLSKKSKTILWLRWAAVFLLGGLLMGSPWLQRQDNSKTLAKENQPDVRIDEVPVQKSMPPMVKEQKLMANNARKKKENKVNPAPSLLTTVAVLEAAPEMETPSLTPIQAGKIPTPEVTKLSSPISHGIVLTYTLSPVELPLEEATTISEADVEGKKDKSLKRMVEFARNVKNSDSPLGGIRVMKEDLFALDLKKKTTSKTH